MGPAGRDLDAGCAPGVSQQSLEKALQGAALVPTRSGISEGKLRLRRVKAAHRILHGVG